MQQCRSALRTLGIVFALFVAAAMGPATNELAAAESTSRFALCKAWIKSKLVRQEDLDKYGLRLDHGWQSVAGDREVVVLLHGFNSTADRNEALLKTVRGAGFPCGTFNYPNDGALDQAAELLARDLAALKRRYPQRRVALVTHSAGGLVARACIEDASLDPGNVARLIMIAPPTHGSVLARAAIGMDVCEHGWRFGRGGVSAAIADGSCEMRRELQPCSDFLTRLNARQRNPRVAYSMLLGTGGKVTQREMDLFRYGLRKSTKKLPYVRDLVQHYDSRLAEFDEIIAGRGDGAVAVRRARLDGVKDTVLLPFAHLSVTGPRVTAVIQQVHAEVLARLEPATGKE